LDIQYIMKTLPNWVVEVMNNLYFFDNCCIDSNVKLIETT